MLKVVVAAPGMGKTTYIAESLRHDGGFVAPILIVPEQSHFETERLIYKKLGAKAFANTRILSFTKLSERIVSENKKDKAPYAEDVIREIVMLKAILSLRGRLKFYGGLLDKDSPSFAARMLSTVAAFQREGISPSELLKSAKDIKSRRLKTKTSDIAAIYEQYTAAIADGFSDRADEIRVATDIARDADYFKKTEIYIDGFDGFTGGQLALLEIMLRQAETLTITLTADRVDSRLPHYKTTVKLFERLKAAAERANVKVEIESLTASPLFPERKPDLVEAYALPDVYTESNFVAAKIRELITLSNNENYFQSDIAILNAASPETLCGSLAAYGIKAFSDIPAPIIEKPMVKFIITVLEAADDYINGNQNQGRDAVLDLIQSGFMRRSENVADLKYSRHCKNAMFHKTTEQRIYECSRPKKKTRRLTRKHMRTLTSTAREWQLCGRHWYERLSTSEDKGSGEHIRADITGKLSALAKRINNATGDKITEELTDFLINEMELGRTVADIVYRGQKVSGELNDEYRSLWETVISILEAMHKALHSRDITISDYRSILRSVFGKTMVAKPPQVLDAVTVGDLRRTRAGGIKVAFIMGANQGELPRPDFTGADFTENETEELCKAGIFIEESRIDKYYRGKFLIHRAMTLPTERLYITAPLRDEGLKEKKVASVLLEADIKFKSAANLPPSFWASHETALKLRAAENPKVRAYKDALYEVAPTEYARIFKGVNNDYHHMIKPQDAMRLMKRRAVSPSAIEKLNTCMFKYFCSQGLSITAGRIKNSVMPDALTRGSMVHYVLERALTEYKDEDFIKFSPDEFTKIAERYIAEFEQKEFGEYNYARSNRKKEILLMHAGGIAEVLRQMREDMELSNFRPLELERGFEFMLGDTLIRGKTDRLDALYDGNDCYIRVIDYKTGSKKFSYPEIEYGLNLQALLYLFAVARLYEDYKPSGAFYRLVNGGRLSQKAKPFGAYSESDLAESSGDLYKNRIETQSTSGISFVGENRPDSSDVLAINAELKKKAAAKTDFIKLVSLDEGEFFTLAEGVAAQLGEKLSQLYSGDVRAVPVYSGPSPCLYCDCKDFCGNAGRREEVKL